MTTNSGSPEVQLNEVQESLNQNNTAEALTRLNARLQNFTQTPANEQLGKSIVSAYEQIQKRINAPVQGQTPEQRAELMKNFRAFEEKLVEKGLRNQLRVLSGRMIDSSLEGAENLRKSAEQWAKENPETVQTIKTVGLVAGGVAAVGAALYAVKQFFGSVVTWVAGITGTAATVAFAPRIRDFFNEQIATYFPTTEQQAKKKEDEGKKKAEEAKKKAEEVAKEELTKKAQEDAKKIDTDAKTKQEAEKKISALPTYTTAADLIASITTDGPLLEKLPASAMVAGVQMDVREGRLFANNRPVSGQFSVLGSAWKPLNFATITKNGPSFRVPDGAEVQTVSTATAASHLNSALTAFRNGQTRYSGGFPGVARIELTVA